VSVPAETTIGHFQTTDHEMIRCLPVGSVAMSGAVREIVVYGAGVRGGGADTSQQQRVLSLHTN
jgi:hypothetical protein